MENLDREIEKRKKEGRTYMTKKVKVQDAKFTVVLSLLILFTIALIGLGIIYYIDREASQVYANTLDNSYNKAVYELLNNVNDIDTNLNKVCVSNNYDMQAKYLELVCDNCKYAQGNFAILPISISVTREGVSFINKMDGYCTSLINARKTLTSDEKEKVKELVEINLELKSALNIVVNKVLNGYSILNGSADALLNISDFSSNFTSLGSDSISYPSMIFDGPFSDSLENREIIGLDKNEITQEQAYEKVQNWFSDILQGGNPKYLGETKGNFQTYDYALYVGNTVFNVQVTKMGGFLLTVNAYVPQSEQVAYTLNDCKDIAKQFCESVGVMNMQDVWSEEQQGVCYINLAPVQNNVIFYPDLIKVKIDMNTGFVIGYEAQSYAYNHKERTDISATIGATDARDLIELSLNINSQKLCVIPLDYGGELLAYEFYCEYYGGEYYVYIDAKTGKEIKVLKVVNTQEGNLTE